MIIGILFLTLAFVAAIVSASSYLFYYKFQDDRLLKLANRSFYATGISVALCVGILLYNILAHNFQLNYVYSYSSMSLNKFYLVSTFWAGQEGTFLLWLLYGTVFGLILIKTVARKNPLVLFFHMLVQAFILLILLKKNPFAMIWHVHAEAPVGFMPQDGSGLNPLLQNPWMVIHPPTLFLGYSSTMVLFAFAMAAMVRKDFQGWIKSVRPWVTFSVMVLGAGIILGGYWAYATLGWGGYWGWDPVENSSLVPWLIGIVLLHGIIIQGRLRGLVKTNLFLAGMAFVSVLWGSFLTRSGVLADFSVHSFAESGLNLYLISFVFMFSGLFLFYFFKSFRHIESPKFSEGFFSRETFIFLGMMSVFFTALVVLAGTASPIYTGLLGKPANVSADFYNTLGAPIAMFMLFAVAVSPLLAWQVSELIDKKLIQISGAVALVIAAAGIFLGITRPASVILFFLAVFTIAINGVVSYRFLLSNPAKSAGYLTHVGLALMFVGIITSSMYDRSEKVTLPMGQFQKTTLGYELKFDGFVKMPDGKDRVKLQVRTPNVTYEAYPKFYYSDYTRSYMASPDVRMEMTKDIYISPISYVPGQRSSQTKVSLRKGETHQVGNMSITFDRFEVKMDQEAPVVKAVLQVNLNESNYSKDYTVVPAVWMENGQMVSEDAQVPGTDYSVKINSVNANSGVVDLSILSASKQGIQQKDQLSVEISEKPLITVLWFGTVLMIGGVFVTLIFRIKR